MMVSAKLAWALPFGLPSFETEFELREEGAGDEKQKLCSIAPDFSSIYAELLHAVEQRAAFHPKSKGRAVGSTNATFGLTQHTNDPSLLLEVAYNFDCVYSAAYLFLMNHFQPVLRNLRHTLRTSHSN